MPKSVNENVEVRAPARKIVGDNADVGFRRLRLRAFVTGWVIVLKDAPLRPCLRGVCWEGLAHGLGERAFIHRSSSLAIPWALNVFLHPDFAIDDRG